MIGSPYKSLTVLEAEQAKFSMYTTSKQPSDLKKCYRVDNEEMSDQESCPYEREICGHVEALKDENRYFRIWRAKRKCGKPIIVNSIRLAQHVSSYSEVITVNVKP